MPLTWVSVNALALKDSKTKRSAICKRTKTLFHVLSVAFTVTDHYRNLLYEMNSIDFQGELKDITKLLRSTAVYSVSGELKMQLDARKSINAKGQSRKA